MTRAFYIDRIRVVLTVLVIFHHTAITYGGAGGWYYREVPTSLSLTGVLLVLFGSVNQAYSMGFFFLLAGYFTPASFNRKGQWHFLTDRLRRLGIPLALFCVLLNPLTNAIAQAASNLPVSMGDFFAGYFRRVMGGDWESGPLWFAQALVLFSAAYMLWRRLRPDSERALQAPMPPQWSWFVSSIAVGSAAFLIRLWFPVGAMFVGLQVGYFASYVFLFALGTVAWQRNWLDRLTWPIARTWIILSVALWPALLIAAALLGRFSGKPFNYAGGFTLAAVLYALWEPLVAWGMISGLTLWFRTYANAASKIWDYLGTTAYAMYILHAPVLVGISVAFSNWQAPALVKFFVTGTLATISTLAVSALVLRIPGARKVL